MKPAYCDVSLLYVEDEADARELLAKAITREFPAIRFHVAENGSQGLDLFLREQPVIVLTDISMPVMDGIRMAREIRKIDPEVFIIAVTAHSDTGYLLNAIEVGINHYLLKPVEFRKLFSAIGACIETIGLRRRLREHEEHIRKLSHAVEGSPCPVMITDSHGTIEYVNHKFCEVTGYTQAEVIGENPRILKSGRVPQETYQQLWGAVTAGREWHGELLNRKKDGELYWELSSISPIIGPEGKTTHFVAVMEDITERKRSTEKIEALNDELAARAAELEAFNYMVSHDLQTPLTVVDGYCQIMLEHHVSTLNEKCREYLGEIHDWTLRMSRLIETLLDFSRLSHREIKRQAVDLSGIARRVIAECRFREPSRHVTTIIPDGIIAHADQALTVVLLENLIGNAWKFSKNREEAIIEFGVGERVGMPTYFVRDNGIGFDVPQEGKLFAPFQRLPGSGDYSGHGIGLATVKRIIESHGGRIWAESREGEGATFFFTLGNRPIDSDSTLKPSGS